MPVSLEGFPEDIVVPEGWEDESMRFSGVEVASPHGSRLWLKAVNDPDSQFDHEYLINSVVWSLEMSGRLPEEVEWQVPVFYSAADHGEWALFRYIDGEPASEEYLGFWSLGMVEIMSDMIRLPYDIDGEIKDVGQWAHDRLSDRASVLDTDYFNDGDRNGFQRIMERADFTIIRPGIVHGDLRLENIMVGQNAAGEFVAILNDAEFGTDFDRSDWNGDRQRSEWDKPRLHDAAHWYNLLNTQYHSPELADEFLEALTEELQDLEGFEPGHFRQEFFLSVLERTVSMMRHFILTPGKVADDPRRLEPEYYVSTIRRALSELQSI